jgi:hypothetical protein
MTKTAFEESIQSNANPPSQANTTRRSIAGKPIEAPGRIAETIGTGEHARNSFVWVTICWSFALGGLTTLAIYLRPTYCQAELQGNLLEDIKSAWAIFFPIITLALGYAFGKGK